MTISRRIIAGFSALTASIILIYVTVQTVVTGGFQAA